MGINLGGLAVDTTDVKAQVQPAQAPVINTQPLPEGVEKVDRGTGGISLNVKKSGIKLDMAKVAPTMKNVKIGLGWDPTTQGVSMDLDVFALLRHSDGKVHVAEDIIFFNAPNTGKGVTLSEDNRTGVDKAGAEDDEFILVTLADVPQDITKISCFVTIHDAVNKRQNFGMVSNSYCRIVDNDTNEEKIIYVLAEKCAMYNTYHFCDLVRVANGWSFETVGIGMNGDIQSVTDMHC